MSDDEESVHSDMSVPSIGDDAHDPQVRHLIVSEECCRAVYRNSDGGNYICPRVLEECQKRNHIRIRATNRGTQLFMKYIGVPEEPSEVFFWIGDSAQRNTAA